MAKRAKVTRSKLSVAEARKLMERYLAEKNKGKQHYIAADKLLDELIAGGEVGQVVDLGGGRQGTLTDAFATRNKAFKTATITHYDVAVSYQD